MDETILRISLCFSSAIALWSAFILAYNWQEVKQRRWLSIVVAIWGVAWAARAYGLFFGNSLSIYSEVLSPTLISIGIIAGFAFLLWPLSVVSKNGFGFSSSLKLGIPFLITISVYVLVIWMFDLKRFSFSSLDDFWNHISYFSVWYRLVLCACLFGYLFYTMKKIKYCIREYNSFVEENYAEYEKYTIRWIPVYLDGLVAVTLFFFINLCFASYLTFLCHNIVSCLFIGWLSAKVMVYNSPFQYEPDDSLVAGMALSKGDDFNSRFDTYKMQIESWLESERPYLNVDFSLQEIMTRFSLNRTYASRIFNEGVGKSFIHVVRNYRIEYAKELIKANPAINMAEVAHLCGYSTVQAFHKAFVYCNDGLTPGKFAQSCINRD